VTGAPDCRWDNSQLGDLHAVTLSDFEVLQMGAATT